MVGQHEEVVAGGPVAVFWVNAIGLPTDFAAPAPDEPHAASITLAAAAGAYTVLLHPGLTNFPDGCG